MKTLELLKVAKKELNDNSLALLLFTEYLGIKRTEVLLDCKLTEEQVINYQKAMFKLKLGYPIQYLLGKVNFFGYEYQVNNQVLIPRFETEELVDYVIKYLKKYNLTAPKILDIGTGSGAIGLTLKREINDSEVTLSDISEEALEIAKINGQNLVVEYCAGNLLQPFPNRTFTCIVSNPPYIKTTEEVDESVKQHEPHLALYAGIDGLDCYRKILKEIDSHLEPKGLVAFEIGEKQGKDLKKLCRQYVPNYQLELKKDLQGRERFFFLFKNL